MANGCLSPSVGTSSCSSEKCMPEERSEGPSSDEQELIPTGSLDPAKFVTLTIPNTGPNLRNDTNKL
jgi:hypothetical protein